MMGMKRVDPSWYAGRSPASVGPASVGPASVGIELTYLGTAGFVVQGAGRTVVLDPFVTRPGLWSTLFGRVTPSQPRIERLLPRADDVLIGHAHYDHILDAPDLCRRTGARLIGSRSAVMVGRAAGLPEAQLVETAGREDLASGDWIVRGYPSLHGKVFAGRVPNPGDILEPPAWPPRALALRCGLVLNWLVDTGGLRILHVDSADFIPAELRGLDVDLLCLCAVGRRYRPRYVPEIIECVRPRWIVPCHWDTMLTPIDAEPDLIPGVDLPGFLREIRDHGVEPLLMPLLGRLTFPEVRGALSRAPHRGSRGAEPRPVTAAE